MLAERSLLVREMLGPRAKMKGWLVELVDREPPGHERHPLQVPVTTKLPFVMDEVEFRDMVAPG